LDITPLAKVGYHNLLSTRIIDWWIKRHVCFSSDFFDTWVEYF